MPKGDKLTSKQQRFIEEYLIDLNATQAAIRSGYSEKTAGVIGKENLGKPKIAEAIEAAQAARADRTEITADRVLQELARIGFANMDDFMRVTPDGDPYLDLSDVDRDQAAALSEIQTEDYTEGRGENARNVRRVKVKFCDKISALEKIGKHLGMFKERIEHSGPGGGPIASKQTIDAKGLTDEQLAALASIKVADGA